MTQWVLVLTLLASDPAASPRWREETRGPYASQAECVRWRDQHWRGASAQPGWLVRWAECRVRR